MAKNSRNPRTSIVSRRHSGGARIVKVMGITSLPKKTGAVAGILSYLYDQESESIDSFVKLSKEQSRNRD